MLGNSRRIQRGEHLARLAKAALRVRPPSSAVREARERRVVASRERAARRKAVVRKLGKAERTPTEVAVELRRPAVGAV